MSQSLDQPIDKKTGFFTSFDGTRIYYEVRGSGRPIFLCYGIACLINHWRHQIKYFSQSYQTVVFDYRGHHASGTPTNRENLSIDSICRDINGLAAHLGIKKASFWGHSYGVQLLLRFYDLYPEQISNLVFINGFARNPIQGMFGVDIVEKVFEYFKAGHRTNPEALSTIWRAAVSSPLAIPLSALAGGFNLNLTSIKDIEVYSRGVASIELDTFISLFEQMMLYNGEHVLGQISVPTLIISGLSDGVTPARYQDEMHASIHGSELLRVPYGSHCTQLDFPDFVNLRIDKFLLDHRYRPRQKQFKHEP